MAGSKTLPGGSKGYNSFSMYWNRQVESIGCILLVSTRTTISCNCLSVIGCRLGVTVTSALSHPDAVKVIICATQRQ
ncbi:Uncharacterised protein [Escherichia coli]|mgnify:CR=1 FL=1|nr:Uncharacterised protein [Escherichia coli]